MHQSILHYSISVNWIHSPIGLHTKFYIFYPQGKKSVNKYFLSVSQHHIFIFLFIYYFTLQYCIGFAIHQHESATGVHPEPPSHLPPHTISLGHPSAPAPSILYPALNLNWQSEVSQKEKHQYSILTHKYGI